jgi:hypothetical protein
LDVAARRFSAVRLAIILLVGAVCIFATDWYRRSKRPAPAPADQVRPAPLAPTKRVAGPPKPSSHREQSRLRVGVAHTERLLLGGAQNALVIHAGIDDGVVDDVRLRIDHQLQRVPIALEVRDEHLDGHIGAKFSRTDDGFGPDRRAAVVEVIAIDAVFTNFRDIDGVRKEAEEGLRDGFSAKAAIHPDQVAPINAAFTPSAADIDWAKRVVAAFDAATGTGVASNDGKMLDRPQYRSAKRVLERAGASS